jgi:hypothetical protein
MYINGQQYLDSNPDVKKAGLDPFQHLVTNVLSHPISLKEPRKLDYPDDFDGAAYVAFHKDVAKYYTAETALIHYLEHGWKGSGRWPLSGTPQPPDPTPPPPGPSFLPPDWNWRWYVGAHKDLQNAFINTQARAEAHYLAYGFYEENRWPLKNPPKLPADWDWRAYVAAYIDLQNAGIDTQAEAEDHFLNYGFFEGNRWPLGFSVPQTPGLHLILDIPGSGRCLFTGARFDKGLLIGGYWKSGVGAKLQFFDGKVLKDEATFSNPLAESVFHIILAPDGVPICSLEKFAMMQKRQANGSWKMTFGGGQGDIPAAENDLCFGIFKLGTVLYCFVHTFGDSVGDGFMIRSADNGNTWQRDGDYGEKVLWCGNSDGQRILIAGERNGHPWVIDKGKNTVAERSDLQGEKYSQCCGKDGKWTFAGDNFIDYWEGGTPRTVFHSDRPYAMWTEVDPVTGYRIALFSVWNEISYSDAQVVISKDDGKTWAELCDVPCPCLLGAHFADGGVYLFGGKYGEYGRVYFYKF